MENQWAQSSRASVHSNRPMQVELFAMPSTAKAHSLLPAAAPTEPPAQPSVRKSSQPRQHAGQTHPEAAPRQQATAPTTQTNTAPATSTNHTSTEAAHTNTTVAGGAAPSADPDRLTPIALHSNPPPTYPALSREAGETGRVLLRAEISAEGRVKQLEIQDSSGFRRLDQAALNAVQQWRFQPATANGQPIAGVALIPLRFTLD